MKTTEVNKELIGRRCECIFTGLMVTGVIEDTEENEHTIEVKVRFDRPHQWGDDLYNDVWAWGRKIDEFGTLRHLQLLEDKPDFQTMTVVFGEPISQIDRSVFEDVATWGVCSLQGWVNSYESVRFVAINDHTAVITGEYNMEQVKVWLEKYTVIVKTCSDSLFSIGQKNCQLFVAKLRNFLDSHNRMVLY